VVATAATIFSWVTRRRRFDHAEAAIDFFAASM